MSSNLVVVLGVGRYNFKDRQTGKDVMGTKVHFYYVDPPANTNVKGHIPQTVNVAYDKYEEFIEVPAVYNLEISVVMQGNKPKLSVDNFVYNRSEV